MDEYKAYSSTEHDTNKVYSSTEHDTNKVYTQEDFDKLMASGEQVLMGPVAGDTDSIYFCEDGLINTLEGSEKMTYEEKRDFLIRFNTEFLDKHNEEFMNRLFAERHCRTMGHAFELETIAYSDIRLDVKKRYCQLIAFKDGHIFHRDNLKFKSKGLEVIKSSYPALARKQLKEFLGFLLDTDLKGMPLAHRLNQISMGHKQAWMERPVEDLCENKSVNGYTKYIASDDDPVSIRVNPKCPYQVRGLANYNWCIKSRGCSGEEIYGGKCKVYPVKKKHIKDQDNSFAFQHGTWQDWCEKYFPCDRNACFQKFYLDPINRILNAIGEKEMNIDGRLDINLFDFL